MLLAQAEGIVPALKVNDATKATLDLAQEAGEEKVFLFNLCGHFDLAAYKSSTSPATLTSNIRKRR